MHPLCYLLFCRWFLPGFKSGGGLQGALDTLRGQGFSSQVDDWVSTAPGDNAEVQPQQVQSLFDDAEIAKIAQET